MFQPDLICSTAAKVGFLTPSLPPHLLDLSPIRLRPIPEGYVDVLVDHELNPMEINLAPLGDRIEALCDAPCLEWRSARQSEDNGISRVITFASA
ncbi:MAG: hypothetical protein CMM47_01255 [Rhodospirillaceae bacterium]|nr:hypothetical protein [Rhodospirillaceae bacterium]